MRIARFILALLCASAPFKPALAASLTPQDRAAIRAFESRVGLTAPKTLAERMAQLNVPGVSIAFIEDGRVKWARAYGVATAGASRPVTPETLFQAASMSKAVAAAGALRLVERGKLSLDDDINHTLKSWKVSESHFTATQKVTLRALLSHTAGMTVGGFPGYEAGKPVPDVIRILDGQPPSNTPPVRSFEAPGSAFAYSGGGYTVAQLAMIEAGGRDYPHLLQALILRPAGMRRSTFAQPLPNRLAARAASGHTVKGAPIQGLRNTYPEYAAAGLWTTPSDYGRFLIGLQNAYAGRGPAFLTPAGVREMTTPVDAAAGYGLGLALGRRGGHPYVQHGGSNAGFQCNAVAFLDGSRQGLVIMTNGDGGNILIGDIVRAVGEAYGWGAFDPTNKVAPRRAPFVPPVAK